MTLPPIQFGLRTYLPSQRHFNDVATLFIGLASFNAAMSMFTVNQGPLQRFDVEHTSMLTGRVAHARFRVHGLMTGVAQNIWPATLTLELAPGTSSQNLATRGVQLQSDAVTNMVVQLVGTAFLRYYERNADRPKTAFGGHPKDWPELWRFAWLLRNAIAHSDSWSIRDSSIPPTAWRGIEVRPSDDGSRWFDHGRFMGGGDVIAFLEELDASSV
jgi:hypothetical protein